MRLRTFSPAVLTLAAASLLAFSGGCAPTDSAVAGRAGEDGAAEAAAAAEGDGTIEAVVDPTGALHFPSPEAFFAAIDVLSEMSEDEVLAWEQSLGFTSFRGAFEELMSTAADMDDDDAAKALLLAHPELVVVDGDQVRPTITAAGYAALVGPDGVFFVGDTIHKVLPEVVVSLDGGDRGALQDAVAELESSGVVVGEDMLALSNGAQAVRYADDESAGPADLSVPGDEVSADGSVPLPPPAGCTSSRNAFYQTSNRKVDFTIRTYRYYCAGCCGNFYNEVRVDWYFYGYKKNIWGNWKSYKTSYTHRNVAMQLTAPHVTGYNGVSSIFNYQSYNVSYSSGSSPGDMTHWYVPSKRVGNKVQNAWIQIPYFDKVKGQGKSRGTGTNGWANICCGYSGGCGF